MGHLNSRRVDSGTFARRRGADRIPPRRWAGRSAKPDRSSAKTCRSLANAGRSSAKAGRNYASDRYSDDRR